MIGYYNWPNFITGLALALALMACWFAAQGNLPAAMLCLMYAGVCDGLDGTVARKMNTPPDARLFGTQLDSIVDAIAYGVAPVAIGYSYFNLSGPLDLIVFFLYVAAAAIRLSYFNIHGTTAVDGKKYYRGLPSTNASAIFPTLFILSYFVPLAVMQWLAWVTYLLVAIMFVLDVPIRDMRSALVVGNIILLSLTLFWGQALLF